MSEKALVIAVAAILVATLVFAGQNIGWLAAYANAWDSETFSLDFAIHADFNPVDPEWAVQCRERYQVLTNGSLKPELMVPLAEAAA